jgi:hypothetical protein
MPKDTGNWSSFWDLATPGEAADALRGFYGAAASAAAAQCVSAAESDGRASDQRFWLAVHAALEGTP